jgi:flagellar basal-body rod protein FlgC
MTDINAAIAAAASGMRAQTVRMRIAAENVANANSTGTDPNQDPFRRRIPLLESTTLASGARGVQVKGAAYDMSDFRQEYNPSHPAADANGYVQLPNVDTLVEMMDLREATRAYEANLNMIEAARTMTNRALDLLRR